MCVIAIPKASRFRSRAKCVGIFCPTAFRLSACRTVRCAKIWRKDEPVVLADGRTIDSEDVLGPPEGRKKLVVVGDTETTDGLAEHVRDADLMVIEATFLERDAAMALDYGHLTAAKAAELAATAGVKRLVLTHISGRYTDEEILAEATKIFPNSRVAADLDRLAV